MNEPPDFPPKLPPTLPPAAPSGAGTAASPAAAGHSYALAELCVLAGLSVRTVRYYMQLGLLDRPEGETRAARYGARHLEQLLQIRKWSEAGLALERIRELLHGAPPPVAARVPQPGTVEMRSHVRVAEGVEVSIEPGRAGLSPEQVRRFVRGVMAAYAQACVASAGAQAGRQEGGEAGGAPTGATGSGGGAAAK